MSDSLKTLQQTKVKISPRITVEMTAVKVYRRVCVWAAGILQFMCQSLKQKDTDSIREEMTAQASFIFRRRLSLSLSSSPNIPFQCRILTGERGRHIAKGQQSQTMTPRHTEWKSKDKERKKIYTTPRQRTYESGCVGMRPAHQTSIRTQKMTIEEMMRTRTCKADAAGEMESPWRSDSKLGERMELLGVVTGAGETATTTTQLHNIPISKKNVIKNY